MKKSAKATHPEKRWLGETASSQEPSWVFDDFWVLTLWVRYFLKTSHDEIPGGLIVRIQGFQCHGLGSIPGRGSEIPKATWPKQHPYDSSLMSFGSLLRHQLLSKASSDQPVSNKPLLHQSLSMQLVWFSFTTIENESVSDSVVSNSGSRGHRSLAGYSPWDSPGKNTGEGCHALLQGIFPADSLPSEPPGKPSPLSLPPGIILHSYLCIICFLQE